MRGLPIDLGRLLGAQVDFRHRRDAMATFELTAEGFPPNGSYFVSAGADCLLEDLPHLRFSSEDLAFLETTQLFDREFLDHLEGLRFGGDIHGIPEGELFFLDEPMLQVTAPLPQSMLIEIALGSVRFSSLVATKAARFVLAARGRTLIDFSLPSCASPDAAQLSARSSYLAGFSATSNIEAARRYGIPVAGTLDRTSISGHVLEEEAFRSFAETYPDQGVLLIDTIDAIEGARKAAAIGRRLLDRGKSLQGVRIDGEDLVDIPRKVRSILDSAGLPSTTIFAGSPADELAVEGAVREGAPIRGFGVGPQLLPSPVLMDSLLAYRLVEYDGRPASSSRAGGSTVPGRKQVYRIGDAQARPRHDILAPALSINEMHGYGPKARPLLIPWVTQGRLVVDHPQDLQTPRDRCAQSLRILRQDVARLRDPARYQVRRSPELARFRPTGENPD